MPSIYKPSYTRKDSKTGKKVTKKLKKWYIEYIDAQGIKKRIPGFVDKEATKQLAAKIEKEVALESAGIVDQFSIQAKRPISEQLSDFRKHLEAKDITTKQVNQVINRVTAAFKGCEFLTLKDLDPEKLNQWLAKRRKNGLSARTSNFYLKACRSFCNWLRKFNRYPENPFDQIETVKIETDIRHQRRALSFIEVAKLISVTKTANRLCCLGGEDRAILYLTAFITGIRASELASLKPSSFNFETTPATVTIESAYSKRRRKDVLPLHASVKDTIEDWIQRKKKGDEFLWPGNWSKKAAKMMRGDLKRAEIPYKTKEGYADFHALRHSFLTALARSGVHPKAMQGLARHSTVKLTLDNYSHFELDDLNTALKQLELPTKPELVSEPIEKSSVSLHVGQHVGNTDFSCHSMTSEGNEASNEEEVVKNPKGGKIKQLIEEGTYYLVKKIGGGTRIRTGDDGFANRCLSHLAMPPLMFSFFMGGSP